MKASLQTRDTWEDCGRRAIERMEGRIYQLERKAP